MAGDSTAPGEAEAVKRTIAQEGFEIWTSDLRVMSVFGLRTVNAEITYTYSNSKALRPRTSGEHVTHGTLVFQNLMYSLMYIFPPTFNPATAAPQQTHGFNSVETRR